jgi:hypothetical protein
MGQLGNTSSTAFGLTPPAVRRTIASAPHEDGDGTAVSELLRSVPLEDLADEDGAGEDERGDDREHDEEGRAHRPQVLVLAHDVLAMRLEPRR